VFSCFFFNLYKLKKKQGEQSYIDLLKPKYNILRTAGSSLGYKHSEEATAKIVASKKDKAHSAE
jgi:ABC-type Fe3+ transport system substrate-binding protein